MTNDEKKARIEVLTRTIAYAHALGVRAAVCANLHEKDEATRIYREAKDELALLQGYGV